MRAFFCCVCGNVPSLMRPILPYILCPEMFALQFNTFTNDHLTTPMKVIAALWLLFYICIVGSTGRSAFYRGKGDAALRRASAAALQSVKIYIYPLRLPQFDRSHCKEDFIAEYTLPSFFRAANMTVRDPDQADYFYIDYPFTCHYLWHHARHPGAKNRDSSFHSALRHVIREYPFYNRSGGADHLLALTIDLGRCHFARQYREHAHALQTLMEELKNIITFSNFGYAKDHAYFSQMRSGADCNCSTAFQVEDLQTCNTYRHNDIVIPQYVPRKKEGVHERVDELLESEPDLDFFFLGTFKCGGVTSPLGRTVLRALSNESSYFAPNVSHISSPKYIVEGMSSKQKQLAGGADVRSSVFSFCPSGSAPWSARLYDTLSTGSIPAIIADDIVMPFERFLDWSSFVSKVAHTGDPCDTTQFEQQVRHLTDQANQFRAAVRRAAVNITCTYVYNKRLNGMHALPWLTWSGLGSSDRSAFHLVALELLCRLRRVLTPEKEAARQQVCADESVVKIANMSYI